MESNNVFESYITEFEEKLEDANALLERILQVFDKDEVFSGRYDNLHRDVDQFLYPEE